MKELEKSFVGTGEVKGLIFTQVKANGYAYIYEVKAKDGCTWYEVFERRVSNARKAMMNGVEVNFEEKVIYPSSNSFGVYAWCPDTYNKAELMYNEITNRVKDRLKKKKKVSQS